MEKPIKPNFYNVWLTIKYTFYGGLYVAVIRVDLLNNLWIFAPLVAWAAIYYFVDLAKYSKVFEEFKEYDNAVDKYDEYLRGCKRKQYLENEQNAIANSRVNENIAKYLEAQRIKKLNAKWWEFWK